MNQQLSELRNVFIGLTQKVDTLEKKINYSLEESNKAKQASELARDISLKEFHSDLQKMEIETIRKLFSGSAPSLDEIINNMNEDILSCDMINIFESESDNVDNDDKDVNNDNVDDDKHDMTDGKKPDDNKDNDPKDNHLS